MSSTLRRTLFVPLALLGLALRLEATWSVVCVNLETREVGVATATCLEDFNIKRGVPVIVVGEGAAAAQSILDFTAENRRLIYFSFRDTEETPAEILARLAQQDAIHQGRQYGIVNFTGPPVTFTGNGAGAAAAGVTGQVGPYVYAIQGNLLTGPEVVFAAEAAFRGTKGDMGQRIMAAMHAARDLGGDGRCSCSGTNPTGCGVPPPGFTKAAHVGTIVVARMGDSNGGCNANRGCAKGDYYLSINVIGGQGDPDPIFTLQDRYDVWRSEHVGQPDGSLSTALGPSALPADGVSKGTLKVELRDIDGNPVPAGEVNLSVSAVEGGDSGLTVGPFLARGGGRFEAELTAGALPGIVRLAVVAETPVLRATLFPWVEITLVEPPALSVAPRGLSAGAGGVVPIAMSAPSAPGAPYWIVAALARDLGGVRPGATGFFARPLVGVPVAPALLDGSGHGEVALQVPAGLPVGAGGARLWLRGAILESSGGLRLTPPVSLEVGP